MDIQRTADALSEKIVGKKDLIFTQFGLDAIEFDANKISWSHDHEISMAALTDEVFVYDDEFSTNVSDLIPGLDDDFKSLVLSICNGSFRLSTYKMSGSKEAAYVAEFNHPRFILRPSISAVIEGMVLMSKEL